MKVDFIHRLVRVSFVSAGHRSNESLWVEVKQGPGQAAQDVKSLSRQPNARVRSKFLAQNPGVGASHSDASVAAIPGTYTHAPQGMRSRTSSGSATGWTTVRVKGLGW